MQNARKNYHFAFQITRKIVFEVEYYTLGSNKTPYFTTSAAAFNQPKTDFNQCGQAQKSLLTGAAMEFYQRFDEYHLHELSAGELSAVLNEIEHLKAVYNYIESENDINFYDLKELSKQKVKTVI